MIVVSDTSPITNLIQVNKLFILQKLFHEIIIPPSVYKELCEIETQKALIESQKWVIVKEPLDKYQVAVLQETLDIGEAEAIALAIQLKADYLLIDERKGRIMAEEINVKLVGLLGLLIKAKSEDVIELVKPIMDDLMSKAGFYLHQSLYNKVLEITGE